MGRARLRVSSQYSGGAKAELFKLIEPAITDPEAIYYESLSLKAGLTTGALRTAVHRLRRRFGDASREEIAETVADAEEAELEFGELLGHG